MKYLANGLNWLGFLGGRPVASSHRSNEVPYIIKFSAFSNHLVIFMKLLNFLIEALIIEFPNWGSCKEDILRFCLSLHHCNFRRSHLGIYLVSWHVFRNVLKLCSWQFQGLSMSFWFIKGQILLVSKHVDSSTHLSVELSSGTHIRAILEYIALSTKDIRHSRINIEVMIWWSLYNQAIRMPCWLLRYTVCIERLFDWFPLVKCYNQLFR